MRAVSIHLILSAIGSLTASGCFVNDVKPVREADTATTVDSDANFGSNDGSPADLGQAILTLRSTSTTPHIFTAIVNKKSGQPLTWVLTSPEGSTRQRTVGNIIKHQFQGAGEKYIQLYSQDGTQGISAIDLRDAALVGAIPIEVTRFSELRSLNLSGNQITGTIPAEVGQLRKLEVLNLSANQIRGTIPAALGQLTSLVSLQIVANGLTGAEPGSFRGLLRLRFVSLHDNELTQSAADTIIDEIYRDRDLSPKDSGKALDLGGRNAAPSTETLTKVNDLRALLADGQVATAVWTIMCTGC